MNKILKKLKIDEFCMKRNITPNNITFINFILSPSHFFVKNNRYIQLLTFYTCVICDVMDGFVARENNKVSKFGAKLDVLGDITSHVTLFVNLLKNRKSKKKVIALILISIYGAICEGKALKINSKLIYKSDIISMSEISDYILIPLFILLVN